MRKQTQNPVEFTQGKKFGRDGDGVGRSLHVNIHAHRYMFSIFKSIFVCTLKKKIQLWLLYFTIAFKFLHFCFPQETKHKFCFNKSPKNLAKKVR